VKTEFAEKLADIQEGLNKIKKSITLIEHESPSSEVRSRTRDANLTVNELNLMVEEWRLRWGSEGAEEEESKSKWVSAIMASLAAALGWWTSDWFHETGERKKAEKEKKEKKSEPESSSSPS